MPAKKTKTKNYGHAEVLAKFSELTKEPTQFLRPQLQKSPALQQILQNVYKICFNSELSKKQKQATTDVLPELIVDEMDEEQIWQQLEIRNNIVLPKVIENASKLLALRLDKFEIRLNEEEEDGEEDEDADDDLDHDDEELLNSDEDLDEDLEEEQEDNKEDEENVLKNTKKNFRTSVVDDKFFKLGEMEEFLEAEDAKELRKQNSKATDQDDDGINYFAEDFGVEKDDDVDDDDEDDDDDESEDKNNPNFKDFFDMDNEDDEVDEVNNKTKKKQQQQKNDKTIDNGDDNSDDGGDDDEEENDQYAESDKIANGIIENYDDDEDDNDDKPKSSFEMRQERLQQRIRDYEDVVLGEKPWQLKGEIQATNRPQNSLLEEILEFESTVRPAPIITEETTRCLEDIIRQRIKDKAWDDVELKIRPIHTPQEYRKQLVLDQEKSKESLAQIYEKEYQSELSKFDPNKLDQDKTEEPKEHQEIRRMMNELFVKLDALSNFHFIPKPVLPETKILTNTPAITMEEVAPVAISDANLLAPEEVYRGPKHELVGASERNRTDKNRERRKKKQKQRAIHKAMDAKDVHRQKMGIPLTKKAESAKLMKNLTKHRNVEKMTASNDHKSLKSSKAFFSKLQDNVTSSISNGKQPAKRKPADATTLSAKRLKL